MKTSGKEIVTKICLNGEVFTTASTNNSKKTNCFIRSKDDRFFMINRFDKDNNEFYGNLIKTKPFQFSYQKYENLNIDYLYECEITDVIFSEVVIMIERKVHYVREFEQNSSQFKFERKGYLVDLKHHYHN